MNIVNNGKRSKGGNDKARYNNFSSSLTRLCAKPVQVSYETYKTCSVYGAQYIFCSNDNVSTRGVRVENYSSLPKVTGRKTGNLTKMLDKDFDFNLSNYFPDSSP